MEKVLRDRSIGISVAAAVIVVASFLPWGEIQATPSIPMLAPSDSALVMPKVDAVAIRVTLTGWNGSATLFGATVPNWLTVFLALTAAGVAWSSASKVWNPPNNTAAYLSGVGLGQMVLATMMILFAGHSSLGIGALLALAAFVALYTACRRLANELPAPAE